MRRTRDIALHAGICIAAALTGIAAAYVLNEWVLPWWDPRHPPCAPDSPDDEPKPAVGSSPQPPTIAVDPVVEPEPPASVPEHADPNTPPTCQTRSLPPIRTHSLPPPLPNGRAVLSSSSFAMNPDAMTSSTSLHTQDSTDDESASQSMSSDTDSEPFVDVLSPPPTNVISRRRSFRNHDLFATSHISFSELGNLVAPQDELH